ncbi:MAG: putative rane protein [Paenibacillus sp.]|nr:putative rane protein [Paenibacillus sp.]
MPQLDLWNWRLLGYRTEHLQETAYGLNYGGFADSANKFRGYKLSYNDGILYIQMRGSLLSLSGSGGDFNITLPNRYDELRGIYIQGADSSDRVLALPKAT